MSTLEVSPGRIKEARKLLRCSQEEFAARLGIDKRQIVRWEKGETQPQRERVEAMAQMVDKPVSWLLKGNVGSGDLVTPVVEKGDLTQVVTTLTRLVELSMDQNSKLIERMEAGERERMLLLERLKQSQDLLELDLRAENTRLKGELSATGAPGSPVGNVAALRAVQPG